MMKQHYETPLTEEISLDHRDPVLDSSSPWYKKGGQGDFGYTVEEEELFG